MAHNTRIVIERYVEVDTAAREIAKFNINIPLTEKVQAVVDYMLEKWYDDELKYEPTYHMINKIIDYYIDCLDACDCHEDAIEHVIKQIGE